SQYLRHIHRRRLHRAALRVTAGGPGTVLLLTGPEGSDRRGVLESVLTHLGGRPQHRVALFPWNRDEPGALSSLLPTPLADTLVVVDDLHHADERSLRQLIS